MELSDLICGVNRRLEQVVEAQLKPNGLSIEQYRVLKALDAENGMAMGDLAARVFVDSPTLTKIIDKMVTSANVYRGPDPRDRRRVLVFVSKKGAETFNRIRSEVALAEGSVFGELESGQEHEIKTMLVRLLTGSESTADQVPAFIASKNIDLSMR